MPLPPSAADWIRFKKLSASRLSVPYSIYFNLDITNVRSPGACVSSCQSRAGIRRDQDFTVGTGKTRREASKWTDYIAANRTDFVTVSQHAGPHGSFGRQLIEQPICRSTQVCPTPTAIKKLPVYKSAIYQHSRIV
jgi:hypothetical protein